MKLEPTPRKEVLKKDRARKKRTMHSKGQRSQPERTSNGKCCENVSYKIVILLDFNTKSTTHDYEAMLI